MLVEVAAPLRTGRFSGNVSRVREVEAVQASPSERRLERMLVARSAVTRSLERWTAFEPGASDLLEALAGAMELAFGAFWVPDGSSFAARAIWHTASHALAPVVDLTRRWHPGLGSPSIGRAFASREPVIASDPTRGAPPDRGEAIRRAGIQGALAVPVVSSGATLAVIELLSFERFEATDQLLPALGAIGCEIGQFIGHRRGELSRPVLTAREREVLQLAARGRSGLDIAARLHLSPATVKRHFESAYANLEVSDRPGAVAEAMRRGLIT